MRPRRPACDPLALSTGVGIGQCAGPRNQVADNGTSQRHKSTPRFRWPEPFHNVPSLSTRCYSRDAVACEFYVTYRLWTTGLQRARILFLDWDDERRLGPSPPSGEWVWDSMNRSRYMSPPSREEVDQANINSSRAQRDQGERRAIGVSETPHHRPNQHLRGMSEPDYHTGPRPVDRTTGSPRVPDDIRL